MAGLQMKLYAAPPIEATRPGPAAAKFVASGGIRCDSAIPTPSDFENRLTPLERSHTMPAMASEPQAAPADPRIARREPMHPIVRQLFVASYAQRAGKPPDIAASRALDDATATLFSIGAPELAVDTEVQLDLGDRHIRALLHAPRKGGPPMPVVLYLHGSGYCIMKPESLARVAKTIARDAGAAVINLDYRLAPEHPYPAALDDVVDAYRWIHEHVAEIGGDPTRIAIAGDSAGGGLAASAVMRLRDEGAELPAAVAMFCPWLDLRLDTPSFREYGPDDALIDTQTMTLWRDSYAPDPATQDLPWASPLLGEVTGFPPAFIGTAELDPLRDEGRTFAGRLRDAGSDVDYVEYAQMPHDFILFPQLETTAPAVAGMADWLRQRLSG
jgi:acetyl esterase